MGWLHANRVALTAFDKHRVFSLMNIGAVSPSAWKRTLHDDEISRATVIARTSYWLYGRKNGRSPQFVDFAHKLLSESKALYNSATGASADNDVIRAVTKDLDSYNAKLTAPSAAGAIPDSMRSLASQCKDVAREILDLLTHIRAKGPHKKWKSFVQALRSVWKKEEIDGLVQRMERLRDEMHFGLQIMMSEQQSEIRTILVNLIDETRSLDLNREQQLQGLIEDVLRAISQLKPQAKTVDTSVQDVPKTPQKLPSIDATVTTQLSENMRELSNKLSSLAKESESMALEQMLLNSLWFKSMTERHTNVATAHEETYKWVFDSSSPTELEHWLRSRCGIYWIMGKAGSGKSTLMKFLLDHQQTKESLKSWAGTKKLVIAKFFFWNAGNDMQKSQIGLFRSLLYEVLRQCPDLIRTVCASKLESFRPFRREPEPWTQPELWQAISQLRKQSGATARFCFFIDGLDEYDGDPDNIVDVLESLRSWPDIKLCISSRPWNEFRDAFGRASDPQLAVEDLTRNDIKLYVRNTLEENLRFKKLKARDGRSQDLVQEIVVKAQGVFLWVFLVIRSLLTGLRNADRISDLQRRLRNFPPTLEGFFHNMLASVDDVYEEQTAQMFKFALEAVEPLSLMTYSFLDDEDSDIAMTAPVRPLTMEDIVSREDDMRRRLNGRCRGLLEVVNGEKTSDGSLTVLFHTSKVDFLHRTVRDFLITKDMQQKLAENLKPDFEPKIRLCKAFLAQMKALDYRALHDNNWLLEDLLDDLTFYAHGLELELGVAQVALLDEVENVLFKQEIHSFGFLGFLIQRELLLYVTEKLTRNPQLLRSGGEPLLYAALKPRSTKYSTETFNGKIIDMLLEHGASPNQVYKGSTVWGHFIVSVQSSIHDGTTLLPIIESLLRHGADPHQPVVTEYKTRSRRDTGRAADLYKKETSEVPVYKSALTIISEQFGEDQARMVLRKARARAKPILSRLMSWVFRW